MKLIINAILKKWPKMVKNGQKWSKNGQKWPKMAKNGQKIKILKSHYGNLCP